MRPPLGYYRLDWAGDPRPFLRRVKNWTQFTYVEAWYGPEGNKNYHRSAEDFVGAMQRAVDADLDIHLSMQWGRRSWEATLERASPYWNRVTVVDLKDEPDEGRAWVDAEVRALKNQIREAGLEARPIGAVYSVKEILEGESWKADSLGWIGLEYYLKIPEAPNAQTAVANVLSLADRLHARVGDRKPLLIVPQAFKIRSGVLKAMQRPMFRRALQANPIAIRWFAFGGDDGARVRLLRPIHRKLATEAKECA